MFHIWLYSYRQQIYLIAMVTARHPEMSHGKLIRLRSAISLSRLWSRTMHRVVVWYKHSICFLAMEKSGSHPTAVLRLCLWQECPNHSPTVKKPSPCSCFTTSSYQCNTHSISTMATDKSVYKTALKYCFLLTQTLPHASETFTPSPVARLLLWQWQ